MEKVDTGMLAFDRRPCNPVAVLERCVRDLHNTARVRGITLAFTAFGSRADAVTTLYAGPWAVVAPRALPHERVRNLLDYLGPAAAAGAASSALHTPRGRAFLGAGDAIPGPGPCQLEEFSLMMESETVTAEVAAGFQASAGTEGSSRDPVRSAPRVADFGPIDTTVLADEARLQQVFYNIIMNAIRASASGSAVLAFAYVVRAGVSDTQFCFGVEDCGVGLDAERATAVGIEPPRCKPGLVPRPRRARAIVFEGPDTGEH